MKTTFRIALVSLISLACRTPKPSATNLTSDRPPASDFSELYSNNLDSAEKFDAFSIDGGGLNFGGKISKFLIDLRSQPKVYFINSNFKVANSTPEYAKYHFNFAVQTLKIFPNIFDENEKVRRFNESTYFTERKNFIAGSLKQYTYQNKNILAVQLYPQDVAREASILQMIQILKPKITIPEIDLAFVATGGQQTTAQVTQSIQSLGILDLTVDKILGSINYLPMNVGETFGYLRVFPKPTDALTAKDIPVFEELPLDLTVVAGVITKAFQDSNSHINLKSKERGTPNMILRDASPDHALLASFQNKPVRMVVEKSRFIIEAATDEQINKHLEKKLNRPWRQMHWEPETRLLSYDEMCPRSAADCFLLGKRYGSKSSNLGFLAQRSVLGRSHWQDTMSGRLGYNLTPTGFGIPFSHYKNFVDAPQNAQLKAKIAELIATERSGKINVTQRQTRIREIKNLFYKGFLDPQIVQAVKNKILAVVPNQKKFKFRSSANAEDIEGFDGAGLYNSYSVNIEKTDKPDATCDEVADPDEPSEIGTAKTKMSPNTINCGIRGVFASLWNDRAIDERTFARIEHESVAMGIAVVPKYDNESDVAANSVVVTRVINAQDIYGYTLSIQQGNNLVTNPDPKTQSELTNAGFISDDEPISYTTLRYAIPTANAPIMTTNILPRDKMKILVDITKAVERAYCRFKPSYYLEKHGDCQFVTADVTKEKSLDLEYKMLANGQFVCKQVREFSGQ